MLLGTIIIMLRGGCGGNRLSGFARKRSASVGTHYHRLVLPLVHVSPDVVGQREVHVVAGTERRLQNHFVRQRVASAKRSRRGSASFEAHEGRRAAEGRP